MRAPFAWLGALWLLSACQPAIMTTPTRAPTAEPPIVQSAAPSTPRPTAPTTAPTRERISTSEGNHRIEIALFDASGRTAITADIGTTITLTIAFRPSKDVITQWSDGSSTRYSQGWSGDPGLQMRYCSGLGRTCALSDAWVPFANEQYVNIPISWIGIREFGVTAQFRDATGNIVPGGLSMSDTASNYLPIDGRLNESTPAAMLPAPIQTAVAQARADFPVTGKITVGEGRPMGAKAGTSLQIPVTFEASSSAAPVTEMRVKNSSLGRCLAPEEMADAPWEPYAPARSYTYGVAINWTVFKLHVQYRDQKGNPSQVYCGEVPVEGNP